MHYATARLQIETLDALVRLKLSARGYKEYDYNDAYKRWINNSERGRYNIGESCAVDM